MTRTEVRERQTREEATALVQVERKESPNYGQRMRNEE